MPDLRHLLLTTALALAACSQGEGGAEGGPQRDPALQRLIEDAEFEMGKGNLSEAGRLFDQALEMDRDDAGIWVDIARLRFRGGEHQGAIEAADHALSLDSQFAPALLIRAQLVRDAFGLAAALPWFERGLEQHPDDVGLLADYAATLGDLGRHSDMLAVVRRLAEIEPREPRVHYLQAVLAARAGDPILASSLLKRSGMRDSEVPSAVLLGAIADMQQGTFDNAVGELDDLFKRQPANQRVAELLAQAMWLAGRDREIVDRFGQSAAAASASPYLVLLVGRSFERLGERDKAAQFIERARTMRSDGVALPLAPASAAQGLPQPTATMRQYVSASDWAGASQYASQLVQRFPGSSDILALAGDAALAKGDTVGALSLYGRAAKIRRPWPLTRKIIHAYRTLGDTDAADALLVRHINAEPRNAEALAMFARRSAADEDWLRVSVLLDTAITLGAGNDPELLALRARAARELGEEEAASQFEAALAQLRPAPFVKR